MKKICFVTYQFKTGGVERLFLTLAQEMAGWEIYLLPLNPNFDEIINQIPHHVHVITSHHEHWFVKFLNKIKIPGLSAILILMAGIFITRRNKVLKDVVFINFSDTFSTLLLTWLSASVLVPLSWIHINPDILRKSHFFSLYGLLYKKMGKIVCICEDQRKRLQSVFPLLPPDKMTVIYNSINAEMIDGLKVENVNVDYSYILTVARLDVRSKDFYTLIDAYLLLKQESDVVEKLLLVGEGPDAEILQKYVWDHGHADDIIFIGHDVNPYKWMSRAEIFILSSRSEGFGLVLAEAMQCGVPVIATDCNVGPREILNYGEYGVLVEIGNVVKLKEAIKSLLSDKKKVSSYVEKARYQVKNFNAVDTVKKIEILLNELK